MEFTSCDCHCFQKKPDPKAVLRLDEINVTLVPDKMQNPHGMQIMFPDGGHTRNIFVYAQSGQVCIDI